MGCCCFCWGVGGWLLVFLFRGPHVWRFWFCFWFFLLFGCFVFLAVLFFVFVFCGSLRSRGPSTVGCWRVSVGRCCSVLAFVGWVVVLLRGPQAQKEDLDKQKATQNKKLPCNGTKRAILAGGTLVPLSGSFQTGDAAVVMLVQLQILHLWCSWKCVCVFLEDCLGYNGKHLVCLRVCVSVCVCACLFCGVPFSARLIGTPQGTPCCGYRE